VAVCGLAVGGTVALGYDVSIGRDDLLLAGLLAIAAAFTQMFVVTTSLNQSYHLTPGIVLAAALLLPPPLVALVVVCQHGPEWIRHRYPWFIQTFNIANFVVTALLAASVFDGVIAAWPPDADDRLAFGVGGVAAAVVFVVVQHFLLSVVLLLARGHSFAQSGLFKFTSLSMDFVLTVIGVVVAELWTSNRALVLIALSPLFLVHRALALPKLEAEVRKDAKTELYNAKHLAEALDEAVERAQRLGNPVSLLVADLDLLREINNRYGHLAGDAAIGTVAAVLRAHVRPGDVAARFGGEEFCVLLVDADADEATAIAERIRIAVESARIDVDTAAEPLRVTVSIGVATLPDDAASARGLLHAADVAAYRAKAHGRNRVMLHRDVLDDSAPFEAGQILAEAAAIDLPAPVEIPALAAEPGQPLEAVPGRFVGAFATAVALLGTVLGACGIIFGSSDDLLGIAILVLVVGAAHAVTVEEIDRGAISVSAVGSLAGAAMFGARAALPLAIGVCVAEWVVARRQTLQQILFNCGTLASSALAAALVYGMLPDNPWHFVFTSVAAGVVYFAVNIGLLSTVLTLDTGERWSTLVRTRFAWLFGYYALYGVVAAMLALSYELEGVLGLLVFAAPLLLVKKAQADYIQHTEASAAKLRAASETIEQQNATLRRANTLLRERATDAMESLAAAIDARDAYTAGHSRRVQDIAIAVAAELRLEETEIEAVSFAALFHDVGKLGVPDTVLLKEGPLDDADWTSIRRHPDDGARIIGHLGFLAESLPAIRHHHERFDGSGYPLGLRGEEIPVAARILHVADAVDSMLSARPYRPALSLDFALAELEAGSGAQFCPTCVDALFRAVEAGKLRKILVEISLRAPAGETPVSS
jgi:diguanylate cyclase (GGDEF)-like protein